MDKCVELKRDINVDKFIKPTLRYVYLCFHFDKLKDFIDCDDNSKDIIANKLI